MPTQRKPTPRKAAFKAAELPSTRVETDRRIPLIILAVIAALMAIVLIFTRCTGSAPENNLPAPGEPATIESSSSDAAVSSDIAEPSNPSAKASLSEYTWDELKEISEKIAAASSDEDALYVAKQYRLVTEDGKLDPAATKSIDMVDGTTANVRIIGFNHDSASDGSGRAGITFMFADGIGSAAINDDGTSAGGWSSSYATYYVGVELWNNIPEDVTSKIVEVTKSSNTGAEGSITETGDVMWLPSYIEVMGSVDPEFEAAASTLQQEGSQYQLFRDASVSTSENNSVLVMHDGSQASAWWLRSADVSGENLWFYVNAGGHATGSAPPDSAYLLVPCFCI